MTSVVGSDLSLVSSCFSGLSKLTSVPAGGAVVATAAAAASGGGGASAAGETPAGQNHHVYLSFTTTEFACLSYLHMND